MRSQVLTACLGASLAGCTGTAPWGRLQVISRPDGRGEKRDFIVRSGHGGGTDGAFHEVACHSGSEDYGLHCYPVELPNGAFILVDCFGHDSIDVSCRVEEFEANGEMASGFKTPFHAGYAESASGNPDHEIKSIQRLEVLKDGKIRIVGAFISPLVMRTRAQMEKEEKEQEKMGLYGPVGAALGTVLLDADGVFLRFDPEE